MEWRKNHPYPNLLYFVDNMRFEIMIGICILSNCVTIGIQTDSPGEFGFVNLAEHFLTLVFLVEIILKIMVFGYVKTIFKNVWTFADFMLIMVTGVLVSWILEPLGAADGVLRNFQVLRALRLARIIRVVRALPIFKTLWLLFQGLIESLATLFWGMIIVAFDVFIFGVFATVIIGQADVYDKTDLVKTEWFASVTESMWTMSQVMFLDDAFVIIYHVEDRQPGMWLFFVFFIAVSSLCLMNLITAVLLDQLQEIAKRDQESQLAQMEQRSQQVKILLNEMFKLIPRVDPTCISYKEFANAFHGHAEVKWRLEALNFEEEHCQDLFHILDADKGGTVDLSEFVDGLLRMQGPAQSKDLFLITGRLGHASQVVESVHSKIIDLEKTVAKVESGIKDIFRALQNTHELLPFALSRKQDPHLIAPVSPSTARSRPAGTPSKSTTKLDLVGLQEENDNELDPEADNALVPKEDTPFVRKDTPQALQCDTAPTTASKPIDPVARSNVGFQLFRAALGKNHDASRAFGRRDCTTKLVQAGAAQDDAEQVIESIGAFWAAHKALPCLTISELCHELATEVTLQSPGLALVRLKASLLTRAFRELQVASWLEMDAEALISLLTPLGVRPQDSLQIFESMVDPDELKLILPDEFIRRFSLQGNCVSPVFALSLRHHLLVRAVRETHDGFMPNGLSTEEFEKMLEVFDFSKEQSKQLGSVFGLPENGFVNCAEFCHAACLEGQGAIFTELHQCFFSKLLTATGVDINGWISVDEFVAVFQRFRLGKTMARRLFAALDVHHKGKLSLSDSMISLTCLPSPRGSSEFSGVAFALLMAAFKTIDAPKNIRLSPHEFVQIARRLGITPPDAMRVFSAVDEDQLGGMSIQEFCGALVLWQVDETSVRVRWACCRAALRPFEETRYAPAAVVERLVKLGARPADATTLVQRISTQSGLAGLTLHELAQYVAMPGGDARDLQRIKYWLLLAVFRHGGLNADGTLEVEGFATICAKLGLQRDDAKRVFAEWERARADQDQPLTVGNWCHTLATKIGNWSTNNTLLRAYRNVYAGMLGACFDPLGEDSQKQVDIVELRTILLRVGIPPLDTTAAFLALDAAHLGVMTLQQFIDALIR